MRERVLNLLDLCMQAKEQGHDVFFEYAPHVQKIDIRSFENGWERKGEGEPNPPTISLGFYLDGEDGEEKAMDVEAYLKELIGDVHTG